jgi:hypothetical protein
MHIPLKAAINGNLSGFGQAFCLKIKFNRFLGGIAFGKTSKAFHIAPSPSTGKARDAT